MYRLVHHNITKRLVGMIAWMRWVLGVVVGIVQLFSIVIIAIVHIVTAICRRRVYRVYIACMHVDTNRLEYYPQRYR